MKSHRPHPDLGLEPGPPDPRPLLGSRGDVPGAVRDALEAGRAELPSAAVLARLAAKLPPPGPPGGSGSAPRDGGEWASGARPAASGGPAGALVSAAAPSVLPGVVVGALLGVAASAALALWAPGPSVEGASGSTVAVVATGAPAAGAERRPGVERPSAGDEGDPRGRRSDGAQHVSRSGGGPAVAVVAAGGSPAAAASTSAQPEAPRTEGSGGTAGGAATGSVAASGSPAEAPAESESALLQRAQQALGSSPSTALALAGEHAARYPKGQLGQEREVIAISALVGMGRAGEARSRAAAFLAAHPRSAHRSRIEAMVPGVKE